MKRYIVALAVLFLFTAMPADGATRLEKAPEIEIEVSAPPVQDCIASGYYEYRIHITNTDDLPRLVELILNASGHVTQLSRVVQVEGKGSVTAPIYLPPVSMQSYAMQVRVNNRYGGNVDLGIDLMSYRNGDTLLVSQTLGQWVYDWQVVFPEFSEDKHGEQQRIDNMLIKRFMPMVKTDPIEAWSTNWLGYTAYAAVVISSVDYQRAPAAVISAMERYIEAGGTLIVAGDFQPAEGWFVQEEPQPFGRAYYRGFGVLLAMTEMRANESQWGQLAAFWDRSAAPFRHQDEISRSTAGGGMNVVEDSRIPVNGLFVVVLIFAILVGPLNALVFARKEKRMRIYWTVPLFSVIATAAIVLVSLLSEGITSSVRTAGVVYLDENSHRAAVLSRIGYYCPLPPGSLAFSNDVQLKCAALGDSWDSSSNRRIDYSDGQRYFGWISPRMPEYFVSRASQSCRDRLTVRYDLAGGISVVNGLAADIKQLWLVTADGQVRGGENLGAGQAGDLAVLDREALTAMDYPIDVYALSKIYSMRQWHTLTTNIPNLYLNNWLTPGHYVAILHDNPYTEVGFENYKSTGSACVVYGVLNREALEPGNQARAENQ